MMSRSFAGAFYLTSFVTLSIMAMIPCAVYAQDQIDRDTVHEGISIGIGNTSLVGEERMRPLKDVEEYEGLKALLHYCARSAAQKLGVKGGFGDSLEAYIEMPVVLQRMGVTLRESGESTLVDDFLIGMNNAAEASIPKVAGYFLLAIGQLRQKDVESVKADKDVTAATLLLHRRMAKGLIERVRPGIEEALKKERVGGMYEEMLELYQRNSYNRAADFIIGNYVIENVLEEFFVAMSKEEQALRTDPSLCTEPSICAYLTGETPVKAGEEEGGMRRESGIKN